VSDGAPNVMNAAAAKADRAIILLVASHPSERSPCGVNRLRVFIQDRRHL
jgi:hypothetical protein